MRRVLDFVLRNWPLKLAAIGLATVLYAGVSLSGNERTWPGAVPIEVLDPPAGAAVLDLPGSVTGIRYRAPIEAAAQLTNGSFLASIDLGDVTPTAGGPPVPVMVRVTALDPRVQVLDFAPRSVNVRVDQVVSRPMTVTVERGTVPAGLALGAPVVTPATVILRGASSRVAAVQSVVAQVAIDASGLNVDQEVDLEATDETGAPVPGVEIIPRAGARASIEVARELAYATAARGAGAHRRARGRLSRDGCARRSPDADREWRGRRRGADVVHLDRSRWTSAALTESRGRDAWRRSCPTGVSPVADEDIRLRRRPSRADDGSRTWQVGVRLEGARASRQYSLSTPTVLVTLAGPRPALDSLDPSTIDAHVAVGRLAPGTHEVDVVRGADRGTGAGVGRARDGAGRGRHGRAGRLSRHLPPSGAPAIGGALTGLDGGIRLGGPSSMAPPDPARRRCGPRPPSEAADHDPPVRHGWHPGHRQRRPQARRSRIALGRATASQLLGGSGRLLIGQDTRRSGDMLVSGLVCGATSMGVDVHRLGVCPTPALSFVTGDLGYGAGIMVSASHNPADDNGLKVLDARGPQAR